MEKVKEGILYILEELNEDEFKRFKWCLKNHSSPGDLRAIPVFLLENADRLDIVDLMGQYYADPVQVAREVLKKIPRIDLLEQLPQTTPIEEGCAYLASALLSNTSHLKLPFAGLEDPHCELQTLRVEPAAVRWFSPGLRKCKCALSLIHQDSTIFTL
uniref:NACHT, LRR and PYD domains-containing protein 6-like isoform X2 n=1 Tax=Gasterosteus aculeatus aculeatus TaxID=481459 RepID=UPI001A990CE0|nr:NACHT, LRR and PYD domains-containing protein 6-like isoform X2 [Gasterosteus aculeatus aculeatus]